MILDIPEWAMGWYYNDDERDICVVDKDAPKEVIKIYKEFDKEYFDTYGIHFFEFNDYVKNETTKDSLFEKVKRLFKKE